MTSAELRWFWRGRCPQPVYDWFFKSGLPPGGGQSRVDRYIPQRGEPDISLKRRGDKPDFEVKGLVTTRRSPELEPLAPHIEIWCKWFCTIRGLKLADEVGSNKDALATKIRYVEICPIRNSLRRKRKATPRLFIACPGMQRRTNRNRSSRPRRMVVDTRIRGIRRPRERFDQPHTGGIARKASLTPHDGVRRVPELPGMA
jgi:hypothetical protein